MIGNISNAKLLRKIVYIFVISLFLYGIMIFHTIPHIEKSIGNKKIFDLRPLGYSLKVAQDIVASMDENTINYYKYVQIPIDTLYPICLAIFSMLSLKYLSTNKKLIKILVFFPFFACFFDYLENAFVFLILSTLFTNNLINISSFCTISKSVFTILSLVQLIVLLIFYQGKNRVNNQQLRE